MAKHYQKTDSHQSIDPRARPAGPGTRIGYRLWQAQHAVERAMEAALAPAGIGVTQVAALLHLKLEPALSGAELARRLLVTPQSTATLLSGLVARGWITRARHRMHRHVVEANLTAAGEAALVRATAIIEAVDARVTAGMSDRERRLFGTLLERCLQSARDA